MRGLGLIGVFVCAIVLVAAPMQQGHPLTGTWAGNWGTDASQRNHLTFVLNWDGDKVTGTINPGPDAVELTNVTLDVTNWNVRFEGQTPSKVRVTAEGRIEDLGSSHRAISGTWRQGDTTGDFKIRRD